LCFQVKFGRIISYCLQERGKNKVKKIQALKKIRILPKKKEKEKERDFEHKFII